MILLCEDGERKKAAGIYFRGRCSITMAVVEIVEFGDRMDFLS